MKILISNKKFIIPLAFLILILALAPSFYFYNEYQKAQNQINNSSKIGESEKKILLDKVGKLVVLPSEDPTIATVEDKNRLSQQQFFANAENGDKVLIFQNNKKAILYRPSIDKVIEIGPVTVQTPAPTVSTKKDVAGQSSKKDTWGIVLYNGTKVSGLTQSAEKLLEEGLEKIEIRQKISAKKTDYKKTVIVDLTGNNKEKIVQIQQVITSEFQSLPKDEESPENADILIVLGEDFAGTYSVSPTDIPSPTP